MTHMIRPETDSENMPSMYRIGLRSMSQLRAARTFRRRPRQLADLPYGPVELVRPPTTRPKSNARQVGPAAGRSNVVRLDRYRERRALEQALRRASRDLTPPTTAS